MLSGLEKFSLDSGDAKNDENQEKINDDTVLVLMVMYFVTVKSPK